LSELEVKEEEENNANISATSNDISAPKEFRNLSELASERLVFFSFFIFLPFLILF
jgi:hypothetical protein